MHDSITCRQSSWQSRLMCCRGYLPQCRPGNCYSCQRPRQIDAEAAKSVGVYRCLLLWLASGTSASTTSDGSGLLFLLVRPGSLVLLHYCWCTAGTTVPAACSLFVVCPPVRDPAVAPSRACRLNARKTAKTPSEDSRSGRLGCWISGKSKIEPICGP